MLIPSSLLYLFAFVWGAIWGSFLNVVIYRLPAGLSIVRPASRCPVCERELRAWHNVPILSWVLLRGRCAFCRTPIAPRYPLVELLTGVLSVAVLARAFAVAGPEPTPAAVILPFAFWFVFVAALLVITFIDIDTLEIPNVITLPGVLVGVVFALVGWPETGVLWWHSLLGAFIGGGVLLGVIWGYFRLTGREGMGLGDFKLMAMVGAFLGVQSLPFVMFASAAQGLVYAIVLFVAGGGEGHREQLAALDERDAAAAAGEPPAVHGAGEPPAVHGAGEPPADQHAGETPADQHAGEPPADQHAGETPAVLHAGGTPAVETPAVRDAGETPAVQPLSAVERFRTMPIPFGPFIALGALEWLFFSDRIAAFLESWLG